jgi:hypothetical protein
VGKIRQGRAGREWRETGGELRTDFTSPSPFGFPLSERERERRRDKSKSESKKELERRETGRGRQKRDADAVVMHTLKRTQKHTPGDERRPGDQQ